MAHLAAQAGVAHSAVDPAAYVDANLVGFANILEGCRHGECRHLLYASSSSVYGANQRMPLRVSDRVDEPLSLYGATKRANELMAYSYAHLFGLPATGLRFFTVYGPWGRPDMAVWLFTQAIFEDRPVRLYNHGHMRRDFTYVDDVIEAVVRLIEAPPAATAAPTSAPPQPPHRLYNVGNAQPVEVTALLDSPGKGHRQAGPARIAADASDRRARNLCRQFGAAARHGVRAAHADRRRLASVRDLVSRLPRQHVKRSSPVMLASWAAPTFDSASRNGHG